MNLLRRKPLAAARRMSFVTLALVGAVGCGTEEYDARMQETIKTLALRAQFADCNPLPPQSIVDRDKIAAVAATIWKPKLFVNPALNEKAVDPNNPKQSIPPDRLMPPFLQPFPGFQMTFEQMMQSAHGLRPISFYVGVQPIDPQAGDKILASLKEKLPGESTQNLAWQTEQLLRVDGSRAPWKTLAVAGSQPFYTSGYPIPESFAGTFGILMTEHSGYQVFLAYRYDDTTVGADKVPGVIRQAAGTLELVKTAGAAK